MGLVRTSGIVVALWVAASLIPATGAAAATASDPLFADQWALQADGPLDVARAWDVADGTGTVVAIVDSGVDLAHPDLRGALWTNPGEIAGNLIDDDRNGWVDDVNGVDVVGRDGDPSDSDGHGTHVAGIVAAQRNGIGGVGIAPGAKIMAVRVLDEDNYGITFDVAAGIRYAVSHGATVINTSLNGDASDDFMKAAIAQAAAAQIPIVASAGNKGNNLALFPSYPASYQTAGLISVAAVGLDGLLASFSNFGKPVSIAAPGVAILATAMGGGYEARSGTSAAAPETAAAYALLRSARPDLPAGALRDALVNTARRRSGLAGLLGGGEIDLVAALRSVVPSSRWPVIALQARVRRRAARGTRTLVTWAVDRQCGRHALPCQRRWPDPRPSRRDSAWCLGQAQGGSRARERTRRQRPDDRDDDRRPRPEVGGPGRSSKGGERASSCLLVGSMHVRVPIRRLEAGERASSPP